MKRIDQKHAAQSVNVSRETLIKARNLYRDNFDLFESYLTELMWWNEKINLVSRDVSRETIREHIVHSLIVSAMGMMEGLDFWIDAGTGGGLPGIPLAIAEPEKQWILNDVIAKKIAAVKQIVHKLDLKNATGYIGSAGDFPISQSSGIVTKHAFSVSDLLTLVGEKPWDRILMLKGAAEAARQVAEVDFSFIFTIYRFEFGDADPFYEGKGLLKIEKGR